MIDIDQHFHWLVASYLATGFLFGFFCVISGRCESPDATWLFATLTGPLFLTALAMICLPLAPFAFLVWILKIEASQSDTRGT